MSSKVSNVKVSKSFEACSNSIYLIECLASRTLPITLFMLRIKFNIFYCLGAKTRSEISLLLSFGVTLWMNILCAFISCGYSIDGYLHLDIFLSSNPFRFKLCVFQHMRNKWLLSMFQVLVCGVVLLKTVTWKNRVNAHQLPDAWVKIPLSL